MNVLIQKVATGDVVVFDKETRDMVLIDHAHSLAWDREKEKSFGSAERFAASGKGQKFSREQLQSIQAALAGVVLLV